MTAMRELFGNPTGMPADPAWPLRHPIAAALLCAARSRYRCVNTRSKSSCAYQVCQAGMLVATEARCDPTKGKVATEVLYTNGKRTEERDVDAAGKVPRITTFDEDGDRTGRKIRNKRGKFVDE